MGRSLNVNHLFNTDKLTKAQFKKKFTDVMKAKGYTKASADDGELSYALVFSADRRWVTVLAEESADPRKDAAELAGDLGTPVLSIELVDSDFAELTLFDKSGAVDTMFLGEPYFDEVPEPSPLKWQTILGIDWSKVEEIQQGEHTFAEDALSELGDVIGCENMLVEYGDADDGEEWVYFKKAVVKKLTLNGAFKKYFGEVLEPLGFQYKKIGKSYFYIRVLNGEILQFVMCKLIPMRKVGYQSFDIDFYVSSLYQRNLPKLDEKNGGRNARGLKWLLTERLRTDPDNDQYKELGKKALKYYTDIFWTRRKLDWSEIPDDQVNKTLDEWLYKYYFMFNPDYTECMELAKEYAKLLLVPILNDTVTLEGLLDRCYSDRSSLFYSLSQELRSIEFDDFEDQNMNGYNASLALIVANYNKDLSRYIERSVEEYAIETKNGMRNNDENVLTEFVLQFRKKLEDGVKIRDKILNTPELKDHALKMAKEFRKTNLEILRSYNLDKI